MSVNGEVALESPAQASNTGCDEVLVRLLTKRPAHGEWGILMTSSYKPANYSTVSPYLLVDGADTTIAFLKRVFGAIELRRSADESGKVLHAEVRIDDTVIMLAEATPPDWPPGLSHVHIYVPDVDATYRKALEAGAASVQAPIKKEDADKRGGIRDGGGTTWWIGTKVE